MSDSRERPGPNVLGQDELLPTGGPPPGGTAPITIKGGDNNPNPALQGVTSISRSDSIVTVPIYHRAGAPPDDLCPAGCTQTATIVGFLQDLVNSQPGWLYEGNAVLHPRGSEYQTQFVVDGVPLTDNRSHSFGPAIDADDVQSLSIYTAGVPAEYGRKMGGVIEVNTLQLGIQENVLGGPNGPVKGVIMNVAGCNPGAGNPAISGGGVSPIPVRLIHQ